MRVRPRPVILMTPFVNSVEKKAETIPHELASVSALAQNKYLGRHNAALKVLFWEMLRE